MLKVGGLDPRKPMLGDVTHIFDCETRIMFAVGLIRTNRDGI